jgi:hypothetical protein
VVRVVGVVIRATWFDTVKGKENFLLFTSPDWMWGPSRLKFNNKKGFFPGIKWPQHEVDHSMYLMPKLRMNGAIMLLPHIS